MNWIAVGAAAWQNKGKAGKVIAVIALLLLFPLVIIGTAAMTLFAQPVEQPVSTGDESYGCDITVNADGTVTAPGLDAEQTQNAITIDGVRQALNLPVDASVIALMTTLVESDVYNLNYGDRDSQGLFQQRPSTGWGTVAEVTDPVLATRAFFGLADHTNNPGLTDFPDWENRDRGEMAQTVQASAYPLRYAARESEAATIVAAITGSVEGVCDQPTGDGVWAAPMPRSAYTFTSPFGQRWGRLHAGTDLAAPIGVPIAAAASGKVIHAGAASGYGQAIYLMHADNIITRYGHVSRIDVVTGDTVTAGQIIGAVGNEGQSTGPHLHFEVRPNDIPIDPIPFMCAHQIVLRDESDCS